MDKYSVSVDMHQEIVRVDSLDVGEMATIVDGGCTCGNGELIIFMGEDEDGDDGFYSFSQGRCFAALPAYTCCRLPVGTQVTLTIGHRA